ncbi:hypothetical protein DXG01_006518 [Tephrocybe rancida]|nr:hypothetical protein DXG01_006518 [Tephrocybe rancida]
MAELQQSTGWTDSNLWHLVPKEVCALCGTSLPRQDAKWCKGCRLSGYCGEECQTAHWTRHRLTCSVLTSKMTSPIDDAMLKWMQAYRSHVLSMYNVLLGLSPQQTCKHQQLLTSKGMLHVCLRKKESSPYIKGYNDLELWSWTKVEIDYRFLHAHMQYSEMGVDALCDLIHMQNMDYNIDVLYGIYVISFLKDVDRGIIAVPGVLRYFVVSGVPASTATSPHPCGAGMPAGIDTSDIERLLLAHFLNDDAKVASRAQTRRAAKHAKKTEGVEIYSVRACCSIDTSPPPL